MVVNALESMVVEASHYLVHQVSTTITKCLTFFSPSNFLYGYDISHEELEKERRGEDFYNKLRSVIFKHPKETLIVTSGALFLSLKVHKIAGPFLIVLTTPFLFRKMALEIVGNHTNWVSAYLKTRSLSVWKHNRETLMRSSRENLQKNEAHELFPNLFLGERMATDCQYSDGLHCLPGRLPPLSFDLAIRCPNNREDSVTGYLPKTTREIYLGGNFDTIGDISIFHWNDEIRETAFLTNLVAIIVNIDRALKKGEKVIIHCQNKEGESLSSSIASLYLALRSGCSILAASFYISGIRLAVPPMHVSSNSYGYFLEVRLETLQNLCNEAGCQFQKTIELHQFSTIFYKEDFWAPTSKSLTHESGRTMTYQIDETPFTRRHLELLIKKYHPNFQDDTYFSNKRLSYRKTVYCTVKDHLRTHQSKYILLDDFEDAIADFQSTGFVK